MKTSPMRIVRTLNAQSIAHIGEEILIQGWVHRRRNMGKIAFLDLRDRSGLVQVVLVPEELSPRGTSVCDAIRPEWCLAITGTVQKRGEKQVNPDMDTGTVEILAKDIEVLNASKTPPFEIDDTSGINEETRMTYRYMDLRSPRMQKNLRLRDRVLSFMREFLHAEGFTEIETPYLVKGTPEGAREYIVPSRQHPGEFYVLPQSPQQFKQLLMVAGVERYFQIVRCFRDEDARGDRQPEFTQLDLEMSFVTQEDVLALNEWLMTEMVREVCPEKRITKTPFPRITYAEAMETYGSDKPDLRDNPDDPNELAFAWVVDFPLFEKDGQGGLAPAHHPFCMPHPDDIQKLDADPLAVRGQTYDLVLNGYELSSGSIRIHKRELQNKIFAKLGLTPEQIQRKFGHLLKAFEFGAPPHGGMAPGIDRLVMILAGEPTIREVIAFPKTGDARDLMMGAPSPLEPERLDEVHIHIKKTPPDSDSPEALKQ